MDFYQHGQETALAECDLEKNAAGLGRVLKQLRTSYQGSPIARAEMQRMMIGGGIGAVGGGIVGGTPGDSGESGEGGEGGVSAGGAALGALLGGVGGALGARGLGRLQEARISKLLKGRKDVPFGDRSGLRSQAMQRVIPRMPKLPTAPKAKGATKATEGVNIPAATGGPSGNTHIPPHLAARMREAGML